MNAKNDNPILNQIIEVARKAGQIILSAHDAESVSHSKEGHANFVTEYDEKVQRYLVAELSQVLPEASFVGEENGQEIFLDSYKKGFTFVLDPIDGTSNFIKQYRPSMISIGLLLDGAPYIGVVYNPYTDEAYYAQKDKGAFCNDRPIHTSMDPLSDSLVSIGTSPYYPPEISRAALDLAHYYLLRSIDIRRSGSCAFDLCMTACGVAGMFFEPCVSLWDYAAGAIIVQEAGGRVTDLWGKPLNFTGKSSILAASEGILGEEYTPPEDLLRVFADFYSL